MNNANTPPKPEIPQTTRDEGLDGAACSPVFSDAPETAEYIEENYNVRLFDAMKCFEKMAQFERERNMWKNLHYVANLNAKIDNDARMNAEEDLQRLRDAVKNIRDVKGRYNTQLATERLFELLENTKDLARLALDSE